jgi:yeast amino acid transporter
MKALKFNGISRDTLPYKAPFQPYGSWFAIISTAIITIFKGFDTFLPFTKDTFVTSYIALPTFVLFWSVYKIWYRTKVIPIEKVDLFTGKREYNEEEDRFKHEEDAKGPRTRWQKFWDSM